MRFPLFFCVLVLFASCTRTSEEPEKLVSVQFVDRNGNQELVSHTERIHTIAKTDFLSPQPYKKVVRMYRKGTDDKAWGVLTSYHQNGGIWQYLKTHNGRANGVYKEWYDNGCLRMLAYVVEGKGDLTPEAMTSWIFDQKNQVFDEQGQLVAEFFYCKGVLSDVTRYYYPNGVISKEIPYKEGLKEGCAQFFCEEGELIGETEYSAGEKVGRSYTKGSKEQPAREEQYVKGRLVAGIYWDLEGNAFSTIKEGVGVKPLFSNGYLSKTYEYLWGVVEGKVTSYRKDGSVAEETTVVNGQKQGDEWCYHAGGDKVPMLYIQWKEDQIHGIVRTYYEDGSRESEREMRENEKHGPAFAWYLDGSIMYIEKYEVGRLVEGKYFKPNADFPTSTIINGEGEATIYDEHGIFQRKVTYQQGTPIIH